jgi:F-type H+-transporting ATPase subunit delta
MSQTSRQVETVMDPTSISAATVYTNALLGQLPSDSEAEEVAAELDAIINLLDEIDGFESLLTSALISSADRCDMVRRIFHDRVSEIVEALLVVMADAGRLGLLRILRRVFHSKVHARQGKLEVTVISAVMLTDLQRQHVGQALAGALNAECVLTCRVDPDLLGGVVVQVGDHVYDASIRAELRSVQARLRRDIHLELPKLAPRPKPADNAEDSTDR